MHKAIFLKTGDIVEAESKNKLFSCCGIDSRRFYFYGQPLIFQGWKFEFDTSICDDRGKFLKQKKRILVDVFKNNELLFNSITIQEAFKNTGVDESSISKVIKGQRSSANGFSFVCINKEHPINAYTRQRTNKYFIINYEGKKYKFVNTQQISNLLGVHIENVRKAIRLNRAIKGVFIEVKENDKMLELFIKNYLKYFLTLNYKPDKRKWNLVKRETLLKWMEQEYFKKLWEIYEKSSFDFNLKPSIDRINPLFGYSDENTEWVTFNENCRRKEKDNDKLKNVLWFISDQPTQKFKSCREAFKEFNNRKLYDLEFQDRPFIDFRGI